MTAQLSEPDTLFVGVGLGFFVECTCAEASKVLQTVKAELERKLLRHTQESNAYSADLGKAQDLLAALRQAQLC